MKYLVYAPVDVQTKVFECEADSIEEAKEKFWESDECSPSICHYCSSEFEVGDTDGAIVMNERGDVLEDSTNTYVKEIKRKKELAQANERIKELIGILKNQNSYHGDDNSGKCSDEDCVGCMYERKYLEDKVEQ
tara:strand:+ start:6363 stop:6764 length:402 start_codon:yes stop_codon:yes gene_type:complete